MKAFPRRSDRRRDQGVRPGTGLIVGETSFRVQVLFSHFGFENGTLFGIHLSTAENVSSFECFESGTELSEPDDLFASIIE